MKKLGTNQIGILEALKRHGFWYGGGFGCGWNWTTDSATREVLESLVKRGLVERSEELIGGRNRIVYRPTREASIAERLALLEKQGREFMKALGELDFDSARTGSALGHVFQAVNDLREARIVQEAREKREAS
jgi:DNA-binding PadR family transcriptional regulator